MYYLFECSCGETTIRQAPGVDDARVKTVFCRNDGWPMQLVGHVSLTTFHGDFIR